MLKRFGAAFGQNAEDNEDHKVESPKDSNDGSAALINKKTTTTSTRAFDESSGEFDFFAGIELEGTLDPNNSANTMNSTGMNSFHVIVNEIKGIAKGAIGGGSATPKRKKKANVMDKNAAAISPSPYQDCFNEADEEAEDNDGDDHDDEDENEGLLYGHSNALMKLGSVRKVTGKYRDQALRDLKAQSSERSTSSLGRGGRSRSLSPSRDRSRRHNADPLASNSTHHHRRRRQRENEVSSSKRNVGPVPPSTEPPPGQPQRASKSLSPPRNHDFGDDPSSDAFASDTFASETFASDAFGSEAFDTGSQPSSSQFFTSMNLSAEFGECSMYGFSGTNVFRDGFDQSLEEKDNKKQRNRKKISPANSFDNEKSDIDDSARRRGRDQRRPGDGKSSSKGGTRNRTSRTPPPRSSGDRGRQRSDRDRDRQRSDRNRDDRQRSDRDRERQRSDRGRDRQRSGERDREMKDSTRGEESRESKRDMKDSTRGGDRSRDMKDSTRGGERTRERGRGTKDPSRDRDRSKRTPPRSRSGDLLEMSKGSSHAKHQRSRSQPRPSRGRDREKEKSSSHSIERDNEGKENMVEEDEKGNRSSSSLPSRNGGLAMNEMGEFNSSQRLLNMLSSSQHSLSSSKKQKNNSNNASATSSDLQMSSDSLTDVKDKYTSRRESEYDHEELDNKLSGAMPLQYSPKGRSKISPQDNDDDYDETTASDSLPQVPLDPDDIDPTASGENTDINNPQRNRRQKSTSPSHKESGRNRRPQNRIVSNRTKQRERTPPPPSSRQPSGASGRSKRRSPTTSSRSRDMDASNSHRRTKSSENIIQLTESSPPLPPGPHPEEALALDNLNDKSDERIGDSTNEKPKRGVSPRGGGDDDGDDDGALLNELQNGESSHGKNASRPRRTGSSGLDEMKRSRRPGDSSTSGDRDRDRGRRPGSSHNKSEPRRALSQGPPTRRPRDRGDNNPLGESRHRSRADKRSPTRTALSSATAAVTAASYLSAGIHAAATGSAPAVKDLKVLTATNNPSTLRRGGRRPGKDGATTTMSSGGPSRRRVPGRSKSNDF